MSALAPIAVAAVLYGAFGMRERRTAHPLIDPRILRQRAMAVGAFLMLIATGLLVGAFFLGSFYLQRARCFSALATGLAFLPVAVAAVAGAHTGSRLVASWDRRALSAAALARRPPRGRPGSGRVWSARSTNSAARWASRSCPAWPHPAWPPTARVPPASPASRVPSPPARSRPSPPR